MSRYFFDIHDGELSRDEVGTEFETEDEMQKAARQALPHGIPDDDDTCSVIVRDENGDAVYAATLSFVGVKLRPARAREPTFERPSVLA